jgi:DNA-binding FadR family transcriptional regulator
LLTRLLDTILADRERQAQRAVEDYLARTGHRLTDSIERELGERVINGGWNSRR